MSEIKKNAEKWVTDRGEGYCWTTEDVVDFAAVHIARVIESAAKIVPKRLTRVRKLIRMLGTKEADHA